jgi:hypothetical protein
LREKLKGKPASDIDEAVREIGKALEDIARKVEELAEELRKEG